jgi:hypothetical protein
VRVICPHIGSPHPDTRAALDAVGCVIYRDVSQSDTAYADLVCELWARGDGFAIVEHDIVVRPDVIDAFEQHPAPYIAYPYRWGQAVGVALGCTRFSSDFLGRFPHAAELARRIPGTYGPGHWRQYDVWLMGAVLRDYYGVQPVGLLPAVEHRNWETTPDDAPLRLTVDGRMYLPPGMVEQLAATLHQSQR